jgi:transposase
MAILTIGIDLAKNVFAVHGVGDSGKPELKHPSVPRAKLVELVAALPPCTIGMEACSGAHHWARLFAAHGHTVRLMAPKFVAPYRLAGRRAKNDAADAAAICEAASAEACKLCGDPARAGSVPSPGASGAGYHGTTKSRSSQAMAWASDMLSITWRQKAP